MTDGFAVVPSGAVSRRPLAAALKKFDDAFATFKALADADPSPAVLNNLGVVQLRRGGAPQTGQPAYFFNKAADADPDDEDYLFNLGYAYWLDHDPQAAIYWLREAVRRNPADGDAHFVLGAALAPAATPPKRRASASWRAGSRRVYERRASARAATRCRRGSSGSSSEVELPHARQHRHAPRDAASSASSAELARFYLDRGRRLFQQENDRDAIVELNHAIYLSPYLADAHLLLGRIHLRNGRVHEAIDAFKIALWSAETAEAHAALGEAYRQAKDLDAGARGSRARARARPGVGRREAAARRGSTAR